jgi:acetylornithine deacetylase
MEVPAEHSIVEVMQAVCREFDCPTAITGVPFGSDASKLTRGGSPTIVFGPGSLEQAHTADEYVEVGEVAKAANMLIAAVRTAAR